MIINRALASVGCVLALAVGFAPELRAQGFEGERAALGKEPIPKLEELALWCGKNGLARERDRCHARILVLDPQNPAARRALQFMREANGSWRQSTSYKEAANANPKNLPQFAEKSREATAIYAASVLALLEKHKEALAPKEREQELRNLLSVAPDDQRVQDAAGEAKLGDKWVLRETVTAAERTKQLATTVAACLATAKPVDAKPEPEDEALGMTKAVAKTDRVRVAGTIAAAEARRIAQLTHAGFALLDAWFGERVGRAPTVVAYEVTTVAEAADLARRPEAGVTPDEAAYFLRLGGGVWLGHSTFGMLAVGSNDMIGRADATVRAMMKGELHQRFRFPARAGAVSEALATHVAWLVSGTRRNVGTVGAPLAPEEDALDTRLLTAKSDWMAEARKLNVAGKLPALKTVLAADVMTARPAGQLYAYVFANYLLLGRPADAAAAIGSLGGSATEEAGVTAVLKMDIDALDARVRRWLSETQ